MMPSALMLLQHLVAVEPVVQQETESSSIPTQDQFDHPHACIESSKTGTFWDTASQLGWLNPGYFARFRYKTKTIASETGSYEGKFTIMLFMQSF